MTKPSRPVLRWHGGKWLLAPWIIEHFPPHRVYVEPFACPSSVLLRKQKAYCEVYNDLDDDVVNLFRLLRQSDADRLVDLIRLTPFAREEFVAAYEVCSDPLEQARRLIVRSFMGFGSGGASANSTGFRSNSTRTGTTPAEDWGNYPEALEAVIRRMEGVIVENRPALDVMRQHDGPETLHYVDPPYLPETRSKASVGSSTPKITYRHELTVDDHVALLAALTDLSGMVILSGYPAPLYDDRLRGWQRVERAALADGARARTEVLWLNPAAAAKSDQPSLFGEAA